jgi:hypothetical protein
MFDNFGRCRGAAVARPLSRDMIAPASPVHVERPIVLYYAFPGGFIEFGQIRVSKSALERQKRVDKVITIKMGRPRGSGSMT